MLAEISAKGFAGNMDPLAMITKEAMNVVMHLGTRSGKECHQIKLSDLIPEGKVDEEGVPERYRLSERITKKRRGQRKGESVREFDPCFFRNDENPEICPVR